MKVYCVMWPWNHIGSKLISKITILLMKIGCKPIGLYCFRVCSNLNFFLCGEVALTVQLRYFVLKLNMNHALFMDKQLFNEMSQNCKSIVPTRTWSFIWSVSIDLDLLTLIQKLDMIQALGSSKQWTRLIKIEFINALQRVLGV